MSVLEYLRENFNTEVSILTLCDDSCAMNNPIYIMPKEFRTIKKEIGDLEVMEVVEEEDCVEIWAM